MGDKQKTLAKIVELTGEYMELDGLPITPELARTAAAVSILLGVGSQEILALGAAKMVEIGAVAHAIPMVHHLIVKKEDQVTPKLSGALTTEQRLAHTAFVCGFATAYMLGQEQKEKGDA